MRRLSDIEGGDLAEIEDLIELARVRAVLTSLEVWVATDCPFSLEVDPDFIDMQGDAHRFVVFVESRGQFALNAQSRGTTRAAGGGRGHVLLGGGLSDRVTLTIGLEVGGRRALRR